MKRVAAIFFFAAMTLISYQPLLAETAATREVWHFGLDLRNFTTGVRQAVDLPATDRYEAADLFIMRGKVDFQPEPAWHLEGHLLQSALVRTAVPPGAGSAAGFSLAGGGALYVVDAWQWAEVDDEKATLQLAIDRLNISYDAEQFKLRVGRQPVTFGKTFFWNPMDWIAPFTPVTIDRVYKPGADVARLDYWVTPMNSLTLLYAAGDGWNWEKSALIFRAAAVVGSYDHELLAGKLQEDWRLGYGISTTAGFLGGAALRGEAVLFLNDPFVRATVGYDYQFPNSTRLVFEYHYNGLGADESTDYPLVAVDPHVTSGEVTALGRHYLAGSVAYEVTPLFNVEMATLLNAVDGSLALVPTASYSLADEMDLKLSGFWAIGERPVAGVFRSEYGAYPSSLTLEWTLAL